MMRNRTITALLALGLTGATAAYSQELVLTLDECLDMASEHDPYLVNSRLDVQAAIYQKQEAAAEYFPSVSLNAIGFKAFDPLLHLTLDDVLGHSDAANELKNQIHQTAPLYGIPTDFQALSRGYGAVLSLSQPVYAGGRIVNGNRLARLGVEAARLQQELQEKQTASQVEEKYWQVVSLEEKRKTVDMAVATLDTLLRDVTQARDAGILTETELLQVRLERNRLRSDMVRLRGGLRLAKMDLFNVMGLGYSSTLAGSYDAEGKRLPFIDDIRLDSGMEDMQDPGIYHR
ncbi:MAG: TolC family protein, partial [Bacteroidales bacterium]|nr:TolC family protein [Bacteroidales bacterium]